MTPLRFEHLYKGEWDELQELLARIRKPVPRAAAPTLAADRVTVLYRRACGHLALARARAYPAYLTDRLEQLTAEAHQLIYQHREIGITRLRRFVQLDFPQSVRAHLPYVRLALAVFVIPLLGFSMLVHARPELILSITDANTAASYERMYSRIETLGRPGGAQSDWEMFGFYVRHNTGIAFQCFAGGLLAGIGSLFYLAYNGAAAGAIGGYLTGRGLGPAFYSFVVTHSAFELTAIVLSGAAGLRLGHALLAPGRQRRLQALVIAARESIVLIYGVAGLLLIAAAIEAFWSPAAWIPLPMKYGIAAVCWIAVVGYFSLQGRHAAGTS